MTALKTKHQVIKDPSGRIKFRRFKEGGYEHYHLGIWIDEDDATLDRIESVDYHLHGSFRNSVRHSASRSNKFSVTFWTWGQFTVRIVAHMRDRSRVETAHQLEYDLPEESDDNYVEVGK